MSVCEWVQGIASLEGTGFDIASSLLPRRCRLHAAVHEQVCSCNPAAPTRSFAVFEIVYASAAQ